MTACGVWFVGLGLVLTMGYIETAIKALTKAQEDANQVARDRLSLERQCFERDARLAEVAARAAAAP